jgi:DivIVA domain-containing protein
MPRLSPEDVANRAFATSFRGYAEAEVRSFLKRISDELTAMRERERELLGAVDELENRLAEPRPLDEKELLDALGEETTRLLRNAREAAEDIRQRSDERATRVVEEAEAEAQRLRQEAAEVLAVRTAEAEQAVAELQQQADERVNELRTSTERHFEEQRQRAQEEADGIVEAARGQGREMVDEAKALRERVLADLGRRRGLLQAQLEELRNGRDHLLDAYRVVKRTFLEATESLAQAEARAAAGPSPPVVTDVEPAEGEAAVLAPGAAGGDEAEAAIAAHDGEVAEGDGTPPVLADVDSLFARIRAGAEPEPSVERAVEGALATTPAGAASNGEVSAGEPPAPSAAAAASASAAPEPQPDAAAVASEARAQWREKVAATVVDLVAPMVKQAKRTAQDEQNTLLDALRRHKGRPTSAEVMQSDQGTITTWGAVLREGMDTTYGAGRAAVGGDAVVAPPDLVEESVQVVLGPLRERLAQAIDDDNDGFSTASVIERIGARYREWKLQALDGVVRDILASAWSRGVFDAVPDGTQLQWVPADEGRCPDCDDNALEPTAKGEAFPTGQPHPPAHPGCRCLLAPA